MIAVPDQVLDRDVARQKALVAAVDQFRKKALNEAAAYINQRLSQPVDNAKMGEVIAAAAANHSLYLKPIKWIGNPLVVTRGTYSTEPETLRMSAFLEVDQNALQQKLIADRAITLVGKYRTYVELFWNVPDKEVHPEVVATVVETIEDKLRQDGYEVVEFERIKGDLVALLESSEGKDADLYATDELQRFKANLALRNIDNRFENGKRILAEYADLLVGATINAIDVKSGELSIRTTVNATYFSQGEWHKLASASAVMSAPHIRGSTENLLDVAIQSTAKAVTDLKPRLKRQLGLRKDREKLLINQAREFSLYFGTADKDSFVEITRHLRQASKWQYKSADFKTRTVFITFAGAIDNLSDLIQLYLEGAGLKISVGEYSSGSNRIVFDG
jgi:hypothetical protein